MKRKKEKEQTMVHRFNKPNVETYDYFGLVGTLHLVYNIYLINQ